MSFSSVTHKAITCIVTCHPTSCHPCISTTTDWIGLPLCYTWSDSSENPKINTHEQILKSPPRIPNLWTYQDITRQINVRQDKKKKKKKPKQIVGAHDSSNCPEGLVSPAALPKLQLMPALRNRGNNLSPIRLLYLLASWVLNHRLNESTEVEPL